MVECGGLENRYPRKGIIGSNPILSAIFHMKNGGSLAIFLFVLSLIPYLLPPLASAEILQLKNGNAIETKILKETDEFVTVQAPGGKVKIPKKDIQTIWRGSKEELLEVRGKEVYFAKGVELYKDGRFKEAAENFEQSRGPEAMNAILYANLGSAYASAGEMKKAEANFLAALEAKPDNPDTLLNLAHLYEAAKNYQAAIFYYQKVMALTPDVLGLKRNLAYCLYMSGDYLGAGQLFEEMSKKSDIVAACNAAEAYLRAGALDQATAILAPILADPFPVPRTYLLMAEISRSRRDYPSAEDYYGKALKNDPDVAKVNAGLGRLYLDKKEWEKAEATFNTVLAKEPRNPAAIYGLAQVFAEKKDAVQATAYYEKLLGENPRDPELLNGMGLLYLKLNEPKKALEVYREIFATKDDYAKAHSNAGLAYAFLGDVDNALKEWTRALELDPKLEAAAQNKKLLEDAMRGNTDDVGTPK